MFIARKQIDSSSSFRSEMNSFCITLLKELEDGSFEGSINIQTPNGVGNYRPLLLSLRINC